MDEILKTVKIGSYINIVIRTEYNWRGFRRVKFNTFTGKLFAVKTNLLVLKGRFKSRKNDEAQNMKKGFNIDSLISVTEVATHLTPSEIGFIDGVLDSDSVVS